MISHLFLELYQPILIIIAGIFSYKILNAKVKSVAYSNSITTTHIMEHYMIAKLSLLSAWLMLYPVTLHIIHEASGHRLFAPIDVGVEGVVLQIATGMALLAYTIMSIHLWAESLERFKTRYFNV